MARVTVSDCLDQSDNRFELVLKAADISRKLHSGEATPLSDWEGDKVTVGALKDIAATLSSVDNILEEK